MDLCQLKLMTLTNKSQINSKLQYPNLKKGQNLTVMVFLVSPISMIGMSFLQNRKVWNFCYCDLFVIWFLVIVIFFLKNNGVTHAKR